MTHQPFTPPPPSRTPGHDRPDEVDPERPPDPEHPPEIIDPVLPGEHAPVREPQPARGAAMGH